MTPAPYTLMCEGSPYVFAKDLATQLATDRALRSSGTVTCIFGLTPGKVYFVPSISVALYRINSLNISGTTFGTFPLTNGVVNTDYAVADIDQAAVVASMPVGGYVLGGSISITLVPRAGSIGAYPSAVTLAQVGYSNVTRSHGNAVTTDVAGTSIGRSYPSTYGFMPSLRMDVPYIVNRSYIASTGVLYLESTCLIGSLPVRVVTTDLFGIETDADYTATAAAGSRILSAVVPADAVAVRCRVDLAAAAGVGGRPTPMIRQQDGMYSVKIAYGVPVPVLARQHLDSLPSSFCVPHVLTVATPDGHVSVPRMQLGSFADKSVNVSIYLSWHDVHMSFSKGAIPYTIFILLSNGSISTVSVPSNIESSLITNYIQVDSNLGASNLFIIGVYLGATSPPSVPAMLTFSSDGVASASGVTYATATARLNLALVPASLRFMPEESLT